ncbi:ATP-binding protein [Burkholderia multivorans]|uniref:AlbA family DNA-binding domain-containing protein n=1 Tax=Burkholderia multivorans TaxID=87883 RepID=UPI0019D70923|nr:RNA-binding domain-containing protein [Burkholderia multivorans]MBN8169666.1 ATP-binding protein [Burkholderia multivorans]
MARKDSKTIHEAYARFFENPNRESFRSLLREHVGELRNCDFKESWPETGSLAKHLLGIGNAGGGCLVLGVKENENKSMSPQGLEQIKDKADIANALKAYLPEPLSAAVEIADFQYDASEYAALIGKRFQVIFVHPRLDALPFVAQRGTTGVRAGAIYVRREGQTEEGTYEEVQTLLKQRLASVPQTTEARDLKEHLEELKVLYAEIPRNLSAPGSLFAPLFSKSAQEFASFFVGESKPNPNYPSEDYQAFVRRILDGKKTLIESILGLKS